MSKKQIGKTDYYWSSNDGEIVIERRNLWAPFLVLGYCAFIFYVVFDHEGSIPLRFYLHGIGIVVLTYWAFFRAMGKSIITSDTIKQLFLFGLYQKLYKGKPTVRLETKSIGGKFEHKEFRLLCGCGSKEILLAFIKDDISDANIFNEFLSEFEALDH